MRVSKAEMERSHSRILEGAARLMRERGLEATSVADVMTQAGLTQGGFYRHFESKEALLAESLRTVFASLGKDLVAKFESEGPDAAARAYRLHYLSEAHVEGPADGCPLAALAGDVARGPKALKAAFGAGLSGAISLFARAIPGTEAQRRAKVVRQMAMMVGAVVLARASDPVTAAEILAACRE